MTKSVVEILDDLENFVGAGSAGAKKQLLLENVNNNLLRRVFTLTYDPYTVFYLTKIKLPKTQNNDRGEDEALSGFLDLLEFRLATREITGHAARDAVIDQMTNMSKLAQKWCHRILLRNLKCGVNEGTINKVWPDAIVPFSVQLAITLKSSFAKGEGVKLLETVQYPVQCEYKYDGLRVVAIKQNDEVRLTTRNGNEINSLPKIKEYLERNMPNDIILDCEAMGADWNESSSVINSTKNAKDDTGMFLNVFDILTLDEWKTHQCRPFSCLKTRRRHLEDVVTAMNDAEEGPVKIVKAHIVKNDEELLDLFSQALTEGFEGLMLKDMSSMYEWDRSRAVLKFKPETTYEGVIVGHFLGREGTKRAGLFAGFHVLLPNGVSTRVGTGISDAMKAEIQLNDPDSYVGKIVESKAQPDPLTPDGLSIYGKMRFPRFFRFRDASDVDPKVLAAFEKHNETK